MQLIYLKGLKHDFSSKFFNFININLFLISRMVNMLIVNKYFLKIWKSNIEILGRIALPSTLSLQQTLFLTFI